MATPSCNSQMKLKASIDSRTLVGKFTGYSGCSKCRGTWNWKKGHYVYFRAGAGMFPLCEECWKTASTEEKRFHIKLLVDSWRMLNLEHPTECSPLSTLNGQPFDEILANAYKAIEWEERGVPSSHVFQSEPNDGWVLKCKNQDCIWHKQDGRFVWGSDSWVLKK